LNNNKGPTFRQYAASVTNRLLCTKCASEAKATLTSRKYLWIDKNRIEVTGTAKEVSLGYDVTGVPVALT
jgi:hypothetical protein